MPTGFRNGTRVAIVAHADVADALVDVLAMSGLAASRLEGTSSRVDAATVLEFVRASRARVLVLDVDPSPQGWAVANEVLASEAARSLDVSLISVDRRAVARFGRFARDVRIFEGSQELLQLANELADRYASPH